MRRDPFIGKEKGEPKFQAHHRPSLRPMMQPIASPIDHAQLAASLPKQDPPSSTPPFARAAAHLRAGTALPSLPGPSIPFAPLPPTPRPRESPDVVVREGGGRQARAAEAQSKSRRHHLPSPSPPMSRHLRHDPDQPTR